MATPDRPTDPNVSFASLHVVCRDLLGPVVVAPRVVHNGGMERVYGGCVHLIRALFADEARSPMRIDADLLIA